MHSSAAAAGARRAEASLLLRQLLTDTLSEGMRLGPWDYEFKGVIEGVLEGLGPPQLRCFTRRRSTSTARATCRV